MAPVGSLTTQTQHGHAYLFSGLRVWVASAFCQCLCGLSAVRQAWHGRPPATAVAAQLREAGSHPDIAGSLSGRRGQAISR